VRTLDPLYLLLASGFVAALISWRLLIGSRHDGRRERHAAQSLKSNPIGSKDMAAMPRPRYRARTIRICNNPCTAAVKLRNKPFLVDIVPQLPLPGCDRTCFCEYTNHDDRRVRDDRRHPSEDMVSVNVRMSFGDEHRVSFVDGRKVRDRRHRVKPYQGIY
jgi:hypothetical protein